MQIFHTSEKIENINDQYWTLRAEEVLSLTLSFPVLLFYPIISACAFIVAVMVGRVVSFPVVKAFILLFLTPSSQTNYHL